jgi:hypothetical protein
MLPAGTDRLRTSTPQDPVRMQGIRHAARSRLISPDPGDLPDVNVVAQGEPFIFTVCQDFNQHLGCL